MEHVTEALYMAASAGLFLLAVTLMFAVGRSVDGMYQAEQEIGLPGALVWEEKDE